MPTPRGYRVCQQSLLYCLILGVTSSSLPAARLPPRSLLDLTPEIPNRRAHSLRPFCHWNLGTTPGSLRMLLVLVRNCLAAPLSIPTRQAPWRAGSLVPRHSSQPPPGTFSPHSNNLAYARTGTRHQPTEIPSRSPARAPKRAQP